MARHLTWFLLLLFYVLPAGAQQQAIQEVPGSPSSEVYDLLKDRKGHLWIAHSGGISRFDGQNFVSYTNKFQNGRGMTDLCEDRQGRIWCHNFEGQIFYVEGQALNLLSSFRFEEEDYYPRIGIFGDELVSCSSKGLFVCNTKTMAARYYTLPDPCASITVTSGGVVLMMPGRAHSYWLYSGKAPPVRLKTRFKPGEQQNLALQPQSLHDTIYMISNPLGLYYKGIVTGDSLKVLGPFAAGAVINTITVHDQEAWLHTKAESRSTSGARIAGHSLSDLAVMQGHVYYSSIRHGLLVSYHTETAEVHLPFLAPGDLVKSLLPIGPGNWLYGTVQGKLFWTVNGRLAGRAAIPSKSQAVESMLALNNKTILIAATNGIYRLHLSGNLEVVDTILGLKDIAAHNEKVVLAGNQGAIESTVSSLLYKPSIPHITPKTGWRRCRTVCLTPDGVLLASLNTGLVSITGDSCVPVLFEGQKLYATRVRNFGKNQLIGTYNHGLVLSENGKMRSVAIRSVREANSVSDVCVSGKIAWILFNDLILELDSNLHVRNLVDLPFRGSEVYGIQNLDSFVLAATARGLFRLPRHATPLAATQTVIDWVHINGNEENSLSRSSFPYDSNTVLIGLSTPWYGLNNSLRYRYRLCSGSDCSWQLSGERQGSFSFSNLAPGTYTFSAAAISAAGTPLSEPMTYTFKILPPWYQTWWARTTGFSLVVSFFFLLGLALQRRKNRRERGLFEKKLAVEQERNRISSEIHDDVGASLSALRLEAELLRDKVHTGGVRTELDKIYQAIGSLTSKIREVIWTLNNDYDSLESLILYIEKSAQVLFAASSIRFRVIMPIEVPQVKLVGEKRRQVYLAVKEALHNCLKHSNAATCSLQFSITGKTLEIQVSDDGRGLSKEEQPRFSNGMKTMQQRMLAVGGKLEFEGAAGLCVRFTIPLEQLGHPTPSS